VGSRGKEAEMKRLLSGSLVLLVFCGLLSGCEPVVWNIERDFAVNLIENMTFVRNSNSGACFGVMAGTLYGRDERTASISVVNVSCEAVQHLLVNPKPTKPTNPISNNSEN